MTHKLIVEGQDFSADCDDVGLYIDVDRDTRTSTLLALAIENAGAPLMLYAAQHIGQAVAVEVTTRGSQITGNATITGAHRWTFSADDQPTVGPMETEG